MFSLDPLLQSHVVPLLTDSALKVTIVLAITALVATLARRASAATRHGIWMLGLITALYLPLLCQTLPRLSLTVPERFASVAAPAESAPRQRRLSALPTSAAKEKRQTTTALDAPPPSPGTEEHTDTTPPESTSRSLLPGTVLLLWLGGVSFLLAQWFVGSVGLHRLARASTTVPVDSRLANAFHTAEEALAGKQCMAQLRIAVTPDVVRTPLTWGWRHPVVLLPSDAREWTMERLHAVLLHEIAHVRRQDWLLQRLAQLACALFWFHPLIWIAARAARLESENASDDLVLAAGLPAPEYARHLLDTARLVRRAPLSHYQGAIAMISPRPSELETRLRALLATHRPRRPLSKKHTRLTIAATFLLALPVAALRPVVRAQDPIVRKIDGIDQYISKDLVRAVTDGNRVVEYDLAARRNAPAKVVESYKATLPDGSTIEVVGLVRLRARNGYWQYAAPDAWQAPDGTKIAAPPGVRQLTQSGMPTSMTTGIMPVLLITRTTSPAGTTTGADANSFSSYQMPLGTAPTPEYSWLPPHVRTSGPWPIGKSNWKETPENYTYPLFPKEAKTFALRGGVASGPWTIRAVKPVSFSPNKKALTNRARPDIPLDAMVKLDDRPALEYPDAQGKWHVTYFLSEGKRLGAEDRRVVAVDKKGRKYILDASKMGGGLRQFGSPSAVLSFVPFKDANSGIHSDVPLAEVKELRLETRPFQNVEFQNIQIPPQPVQ